MIIIKGQCCTMSREQISKRTNRCLSLYLYLTFTHCFKRNRMHKATRYRSKHKYNLHDYHETFFSSRKKHVCLFRREDSSDCMTSQSVFYKVSCEQFMRALVTCSTCCFTSLYKHLVIYHSIKVVIGFSVFAWRMRFV